jgi:predicted Co/Zn/Cd cation transporter (cation efflux family)
MKRHRRSQMTGAALVFTVFVAAIQLYLFETVLGSVLDGQRTLLPGAFAVSLTLSVVALYLAFKARQLDR